MTTPSACSTTSDNDSVCSSSRSSTPPLAVASSASTPSQPQHPTKTKLSSSPTELGHCSKKTRKGSIDVINKADYISDSTTNEQDSALKVQLPDPKKHVDPDVFLSQLVKAQQGYTLKTKDALSLNDFFPTVTDEQIAAYDINLVAACRENDVEKVKTLFGRGQSVECCNRFGESLLHMACRRGFVDMVKFLLEEAKLSVRIRDDCGRTPLHDACWNRKPQTQILQWLIERDPSLLLVSDKRGSTPFQYARPQDWPTWRQFLLDNRTSLDALVDSKETFS